MGNWPLLKSEWGWGPMNFSLLINGGGGGVKVTFSVCQFLETNVTEQNWPELITETRNKRGRVRKRGAGSKKGARDPPRKTGPHSNKGSVPHAQKRSGTKVGRESLHPGASLQLRPSPKTLFKSPGLFPSPLPPPPSPSRPPPSPTMGTDLCTREGER